MEILGEGTEELTPELMEGFLTDLLDRGRSEVSVRAYRNALRTLYKSLPEGKRVTAATGRRWRVMLEGSGACPRTVSARMSVWNSLARYLGHRDWQVEGLNPAGGDIQPELTRREYLRLLSAAKQLGQERTYLLVKVLGGAGLRLQDLPRLTAEAVHEGTVRIGGTCSGGASQLGRTCVGRTVGPGNTCSEGASQPGGACDKTASQLGRARGERTVQLGGTCGERTVGPGDSDSERARIIHLPAVLQRELNGYIHRQGIHSGPIFVTSGGRPLDRSNIGRCIRQVGQAARVAEEKASPRCLWRMYQSTQKGIRDNVSLLIEQAYERQLEREQMAVGWEE